jgi:hypothetical protein
MVFWRLSQMSDNKFKAIWNNVKSFFKDTSIKNNLNENTVNLSIEEKNKNEQSTNSQWITRSKEKLYIQVGVDFGTSNTKVAYKIIGKNKEVIPIIFDESLKDGFCYPSVGAFTKDNELVFGYEANELLDNEELSSGLRRFKMLVAGRYDKRFLEAKTARNYKNYLKRFNRDFYQTHPEELSVVFLSNVFKKTANYLKNVFKNNEIDIRYNVCLPIDQYQESKLLLPFQKILTVAYQLSKKNLSNDEAMEYAKRELKSVVYNINSSDNRVFVIPEAVAEISPYINSVKAEDGVVVLIDFGSGTTDISIFEIINLRKSSVKWIWYNALNISQGMHKLEETIIKHNPNYLLSEINHKLNNVDYFNEEECNEINDFLQNLWTITAEKGWRPIFKKKNYDFWKRHVIKIFICGGGSQSPLIKDIFQKSGFKSVQSKTMDINYPIKILPSSDNYNSSIPFHRICVAFGLTTSYAEFDKKFILPKDAPKDIERPIIKDKTDLELYGTEYGFMDT